MDDLIRNLLVPMEVYNSPHAALSLTESRRESPADHFQVADNFPAASYERVCRYWMAHSSASLAATSAIGFSAVLRPLREPSRGLTSRRASYVVLCTMGTSWSRARSADSSLSAMPSPWRRRSSAGVTSTIPTRDFASPLSISRSNGVPRATSFSLNQTETPRDSSRSCSSLAAPPRSSHAWQRKMSRRSGKVARFSTLSRTGVSVRTSAGVYATVEPAGDQRGLALLPDPPTLLRPPPLLPDEE